MKLTFLRPANIAVNHKDGPEILNGRKGDYFFVEDEKEIERLMSLKDFGYQLLESEDVSPKKVKKEEKKKEEEQKSKEDFDNLPLEQLQKMYEEKYEKEVPRNKKNDSDWIKEKISD